jgi:hypothetical protein
MWRGMWDVERYVGCGEVCGMWRGMWDAARYVGCGEVCGMWRGMWDVEDPHPIACANVWAYDEMSHRWKSHLVSQVAHDLPNMHVRHACALRNVRHACASCMCIAECAASQTFS